MRVGIIGMGHVGTMMHKMLAPHAELVTYDSAGADPYPKDELAGCDYVMVCVSTPPAEDGSCDVTNVEDAVRQCPADRIMIRSTVSPGTTARLAAETGKHLVFCPEYVGESKYYNPLWPSAAAVPFLIVGGEAADQAWFIDALTPVLGPDKTYHQCSATEAEVVKYMENSFFAVKVIFAAEFRGICAAVGADWHTVRTGWLLDPRVEPSHTAVFADQPGFGGKCLPKDLSAIIMAARGAGFEPGLLAATADANARLRTTPAASAVPVAA